MLRSSPFTRTSKVSDVVLDLVLKGFGRLLFPVQRSYWSGETLEALRLTWRRTSSRAIPMDTARAEVLPCGAMISMLSW